MKENLVQGIRLRLLVYLYSLSIRARQPQVTSTTRQPQNLLWQVPTYVTGCVYNYAYSELPIRLTS